MADTDTLVPKAAETKVADVTPKAVVAEIKAPVAAVKPVDVKLGDVKPGEVKPATVAAVPAKAVPAKAATKAKAPPKAKPAPAAAQKAKPAPAAALKSKAAPAAVKPKAAPAAVKPKAASAALKSKAASAAGKPKETKMKTENFTKTMETQMAAVAPAMEKATHDAMAQAKVGYDALNIKMRETMETSMKSMTEVTEFAKGNVEALVASAKAAAAGAEMLAAKATETSKKSFDEASVAMKSMTAAKTPNEYMQMQNDFAKTQFDAAVASWSHMSETMLKLAGDVVQPLSSRMAIAAETMKSAIATK